MTLLERIDGMLAAWRVMLPHIPAPAPESATHWLNYPDFIVERAIFRTSKKFLVSKISADFVPAQAYKYATTTARIMAAKAVEAATAQKGASE